ncbi:MAG: hypothetical protein HY308_02145 [Gammaproteobacteria bacterium]|nr:hypothetical protein [Gammaproteobacteria bacterium]
MTPWTIAQAKMLSFLERPAPYLGVSTGRHDINEDTLDESDNLWKVFLGGQFDQYFSIEAAYIDFKKAENQGSNKVADIDLDAVTAGVQATF